jgi:hypothetical protein
MYIKSIRLEIGERFYYQHTHSLVLCIAERAQIQNVISIFSSNATNNVLYFEDLHVAMKKCPSVLVLYFFAIKHFTRLNKFDFFSIILFECFMSIMWKGKQSF